MKFLFHIQYNALSRAYVKGIERGFPLTNRLKSMAFDFAFSMVAMAMLIPIVALERFTINTEYMANIILPIFFILLAVTKDRKGGRSIGKRMTGYMIVDSRTKETASTIQCAIRNMTFLLWPIEVLLLLGTPKYRAGDFLARTEVIPCEVSNPEDMLSESKP